MTEILRATHLHKAFNGRPAVQDVSVSVDAGEVLGLIGPNGAGKTTTIRMVLRLLQPDRGEAYIFDRPPDEAVRRRVGYLPEERGLYRQARVSDVLSYLGRLKGLSRRDARRRASEVLEQLGMAEHAGKRVLELSRGMSQLIQLGATIVHQPDVVILDEPFSGLDPVNTQLVKELVKDLKSRGAAIILSTHLMNTVEELCDRVLMVARGRPVLEGWVEQIKGQYRNNSLFIAWDGPRERLAGVSRWEDRGPYWEAFLRDGAASQTVLEGMMRLGGVVSLFQLSTPSLDEVFLRVVKEAPHE